MNGSDSFAAELAALGESISDVLSAVSTRRAVHEYGGGRNQHDKELWRQAAELGWLGIGLPEALGGLGLGQAGLDVLHRALGRWLAPGPFIATLSAAQWISDVAGDEHGALVARIVAGDLTVAVPAGNGQNDLALIDGRIRGTSPVLLGADDIGLVITPVADEEGGILWALVEPHTGFNILKMWDETRHAGTIEFDGSETVSILRRAEGAGQLLSRQIALALAGDSMGGAEAISDQTVEYLKTRVQFDRPVGSFQAVKHRAADLFALIATNECLLDQAVETADERAAHADMWSSLAKAGCTDAYVSIATDCLELHGGIGFTWEYDAHLFLRRARFNQALGRSSREEYDIAAARLADVTYSGLSTTELAR